MQEKINVAIVGATGAVGEAMLQVLEERNFPVRQLYPLASARSVGKTVQFRHQELDVLDCATFDFSQVQIALFSAGSEVSKHYAPIAAKAGCLVIDNTSCFRYDEDIPLVVPEVNPHCVADFASRRIIANPNCSTIQMLVALKPIYDAVGIEKIIVSTYQAVSGTGAKAIRELITQVGELLNGRPTESKVYPYQIAFNVLPHIDVFLDNGYSKEEMKMLWETRKILEDSDIQVNATTVRVPVLYGHSESIYIKTRHPITPEDARVLLEKAPGVVVVDDLAQSLYPTPMTHAIGRDDVFVGRIRQDLEDACGLNLWVVADNVRKGAATNAVQIAQLWLDTYFA